MNAARAIVLVVWACFATGCMAIHKTNLIEISDEAKHEPSKTVSVVVGTVAKGNPDDSTLVLSDNPEHQAKALAQFVDALQKTRRFRAVHGATEVGGGPDLTLKSHTVFTSDGSMAWQILSGLTLTLVPVRTRLTADTKWTVFNRQGKPIKTYQHTERAEYWMQLFLLFVMPFRDNDDVGREIDQNHARFLVNSLARDGLL
jgi:hypothetical protein